MVKIKSFKSLLVSVAILFNFSFTQIFCNNQVLSKNDPRALWEKSGLLNYSKDCDTSNQERHATHEAGHGVVAVKLNIPIIQAGITPHWRFNSPSKFWTSLTDYLNYTGFVDTSVATTNREKILVALAGYVAEQMKYGKACYTITQDLDHAINILSKKANSEHEILSDLQKHLLEAKQILHENKDALERLAQALLEHKTLTGNQVYQIVNGV